jgi:hypothetical protein
MTNNWQIYHNTNPKVTIQLPLVLYTHCQKDKPSLTFLNFHQLERQGADIQSKVQELEDLNSSLRERDKVKDDAIAHYPTSFWSYPQGYRSLNENNKHRGFLGLLIIV